MPKGTFLNLPQEKKVRILQLALEEFALNDYKRASLSRIVEKAGIAKGSMYQYFENKKELYLYLIETISQDKLSWITAQVDDDLTTSPGHNDFFQRLTNINLLSAKWDLTHPNESRLIMNAIKEMHSEDLGSLPEELLQMSDNYIADFIRYGQESGQLRTDIPADLLAFVVSRLSLSLADYIGQKYGFSYHKTVTEGTETLPVTEDAIKTILNDLIQILKKGIEVPVSETQK